MKLTDYVRYDALGLAELVRRGDVTPGELVAAAQAAVAQVDPGVNAVVLDMADEAARCLAQGLPSGPFTGVPLMLKDFVCNYAGVPTRFGSRLFEGLVPPHDSETMARFRRAGFVTIAKTACSEFGLNAATEAKAYGKPVRNPWNPAHSASGSSGGSAVAVATRMVPVAYGDDGGGSIRLPASHTASFGLKPSRGRVPLGPDLPDTGFAGLACAHALTRSVRDSAAVLDVLAGPDCGATFHAPPPRRPFLQEVGAPPGVLRIGYCARLDDTTDVHPDALAALDDAAHLCEALGHVVEPIDFKFDQAAFARAWCTAVIAWLTPIVDGTAAMLGRVPGPDNLEAATWSAIQHGRRLKAADLVGAQLHFNAMSRAMGQLFNTYDVLLTPAVSTPPPLLGVMDQDEPGVDAYDFTARHTMRLGHVCGMFNATGNPAMSVPLYWNAAGLPLGAHFVGRYGDEATLLRLAAQLEAARPWINRLPPLCAG